MLDIKCVERLQATRDYAEARGPEVKAKLEEKLAWLENYRGGTCLCELYGDHAPHSFTYTLYGPGGQLWSKGGLIYYGPSDSGVGAPQFSVSLDTSGEERWEIHE